MILLGGKSAEKAGGESRKLRNAIAQANWLMHLKQMNKLKAWKRALQRGGPLGCISLLKKKKQKTPQMGLQSLQREKMTAYEILSQLIHSHLILQTVFTSAL